MLFLGSMVLHNRGGGVKAGPLVWERQFIFRKEVIFEVCRDFGGCSGSRWRLKGGCGEGRLLARLHISKSGLSEV